MTSDANNLKKTESIEAANAADTIAAFATPPGQSGLAVLRLSGPNSGKICDELFMPYLKSRPKPSAMSGYTVTYGDFAGIDDVVLTAFRAPHSYTGEDLYEISCHGGYQIRSKIMETLLAHGAVAALPGEFSKRAFMNGKMDLSEAEAVMDMIAAKAEKQLKVAHQQLSGQLGKYIRNLKDRLLQLYSSTEFLLDFDETDDISHELKNLHARFAEMANELENLQKNFRYGSLVKEGLDVVIAGRPNVGKSTLLNAMAARDMAIVSDIAGTTRDAISTEVDIGGYLVNFTDTAGLFGDQGNIVEKLGMDKALRLLEKADLAIWLLAMPLDAEELTAELSLLFGQGSGETRNTDNTLFLLSKADKDDVLQLQQLLLQQKPDAKYLFWSKKQEKAFGELQKTIINFIETGELDVADNREQKASGLNKVVRQSEKNAPAFENKAKKENSVIKAASAKANLTETKGTQGSAGDLVLLTNKRQQKQMLLAKAAFDKAYATLQKGMTLDITSAYLREALDEIAKITGDNIGEDLVNEIFSRFCVGK